MQKVGYFFKTNFVINFENIYSKQGGICVLKITSDKRH